MTAVVEENTVLEFKGRMLMMTVLQLKNLDANLLHQDVSQRAETVPPSGCRTPRW